MSKLKKAMERAKEARRTGESGFLALRPQLRKEKNARQDVNVIYSNTKTVDIDHSIFRKNRLFSLFQEYKVTDQINVLRTQVLNKMKEIGGNSLLVTSANPGEGKTFTSINLGISIAQVLNRTVLLVDTDLRNPSVHHYDFANDFFGVKISEGLSDYLLGHVEISDLLLNPGIEKLTILPGGRPLPNSAELLSSARMEDLIVEMKNRYRGDRVIIFDTSALLTCTDPLVFSHLVDGILLVVEVEKTTPSDLKRVMELLKDRPIVGTVLNKVR
jgi:non-specific protein-tyrosine kinase